jgi:L,D-transpeptidase YcbB
LEEISYGYKPAHVRFTQKVKPIDSVLIRQAVIDLVNGKSIEKTMGHLESSFPSYLQLKEHYSHLQKMGQPDRSAIVSESLNIPTLPVL